MAGDHFEFGGDIAWRPSQAQIAGSRLQAFVERHHLSGYDELLRRSTTDLEWFWNAVFEELQIEFYEPYTNVIDRSRGIPWTTWCTGGVLNIVHNCLDKRSGTAAGQKIALRWEGEEGRTRTLTYSELTALSNRFANALLTLGVARGERVALFMPMCPELIGAFFGAIKAGAVVLPLFSGYGADAVASRLTDAGASILVTADGFFRRGQRVLMKETADEALKAVPSVKYVIVAPRLGLERLPWTAGRDLRWDAIVDGNADRFETVRTSAEDPLMLIYTSGTTGRPKGAVHTHCGFPIKAAQDMVHVFDMRETDTMFWVSDIGWMMGPWEVLGTTILGATMVIYDGALDYPDPSRLWAIVERHAVSVLGVSPTLIRGLMRHGEGPVLQHDLTSLRILGSTGEPWNPEPWRWLFEMAGHGRLPIINYSGGTEASGGLLGGNVITPIKPCSFAGPPPGIAADVVDDQGRPVRGQVGELIVREPWIGMTRGFWNDTERYLQAYWSRFPDIWVHGDWAAVDDDGMWYILGRSDDTIKIAGKRLGPAEVESVLVAHPAVLEAAAIGVPDETKGQALVCLCVLISGQLASPELVDALKTLVATQLGKPLRPRAIEFVRELPKTRNAKVMRRVARAAYLGEPTGDLSALENPQSVEEIGALLAR